jgi:hypothetical protein
MVCRHGYAAGRCPRGCYQPEPAETLPPASKGGVMDESTRDLLAAISQALDGMADWRAVAVRSAVHQALNNVDRGQAADDLRDFLATRREAMPNAE